MVKVCDYCKKEILKQDKFILIGTYEDKTTLEEKYYHFLCWRKFFEECARQKAQAVVKGYKERMMPIAKQLTDKLKMAIGQS